MKRVLNNQWVYGSLMALLGVLIADYHNKINLKFIFNYILSVFIAVFTFEIKLWWLLIGIAIIALGIRILSQYSNQKFDKTSYVPEFCSYKNDFLKGYSWSWSWNLHRLKNVWVIADLSSLS